MDSIKDDGIYTGFIASHQIDGAGGKYFNFEVHLFSKRLAGKVINKYILELNILYLKQLSY